MKERRSIQNAIHLDKNLTLIESWLHSFSENEFSEVIIVMKDRRGRKTKIRSSVIQKNVNFHVNGEMKSTLVSFLRKNQKVLEEAFKEL